MTFATVAEIQTEWLLIIMIVRFFFDLIMLAVLVYFLLKVMHLIASVESTIGPLKGLIRDAKEEKEITQGLLKTIKGWTVVYVQTDKEKKEEMKKELEKVPEATANKVVEKLEQSDSTLIKRPLLPPG